MMSGLRVWRHRICALEGISCHIRFYEQPDGSVQAGITGGSYLHGIPANDMDIVGSYELVTEGTM